MKLKTVTTGKMTGRRKKGRGRRRPRVSFVFIMSTKVPGSSANTIKTEIKLTSHTVEPDMSKLNLNPKDDRFVGDWGQNNNNAGEYHVLLYYSLQHCSLHGYSVAPVKFFRQHPFFALFFIAQLAVRDFVLVRIDIRLRNYNSRLPVSRVCRPADPALSGSLSSKVALPASTVPRFVALGRKLLRTTRRSQWKTSP